MQKVDGVQSARVSLNEGLTILNLRPGNAVTVTRLRQIIKNNGFVSKEATVVADGGSNGPQLFIVSVTNERLLTASEPQKVADGWRFVVPAPKP